MSRNHLTAASICLITIGVAIAVGLNSCTNENVQENKQADIILDSSALAFEPDDGYYEGTVQVGQEQVTVKYRRLKEPIKITEEFRWDENTTRSPLDSLLTSMSLIMRNERIDSTLSKENLRFYHEQLKEMSEEELLAVTKRLMSEAVVLGEIVCNEVTVVVIRRKSGDYYSYLGNWFVERNGEFLRYSDIVLKNPFHEKLARDQYSFVTGFDLRE